MLNFKVNNFSNKIINHNDATLVYLRQEQVHISIEIILLQFLKKLKM